ncbi:hypothetical protein HNO89_003416 [Sporosarcina luteola]|nr:hypothetical protein [Sporosarcina luteola]
MKKGFIGLLVALVFLLGACTKGYWVMSKKDLDKEPGVRAYVKELQKEKTEQKGFKLFSISQNRNMVVVSTGTPTKELEVIEVQVLEDQTIVTVKEIEADSDETNPYILIGLDEKKGSMRVINEEGDEYEIDF